MAEPAPDLGALAEGRIRGLLLDTTLDDEDRGYLAAFIAAFEIQTARLIAAEERATRLATRLAAQQPIVAAAVALHECLRRCGPEWADRLRAVYDAVAALDAPPGESP